MKQNIKNFRIIFVLVLFVLAYGCNDYLDGAKSYTKVSADLLLSSEKGIKTLLADLYSGMPMEDFNYRPNSDGSGYGFNQRGWGSIGLPVTWRASMYTDESQASGGVGIGLGGYSYFASSTGTSNTNGNVNGYVLNRDVSIFLKSIEKAKDGNVINEATYNRLWSEAHFIRAYIYFGLAKRYGGVPLIDWLQDDDYVDGNVEPLYIARSTELDTWKFVLAECDKAVQYLPVPGDFASGDGDARYRASKWAAYALKSRAALFAASLAKYGNKVQFAGQAAETKLVGMSASDAAFFYSECLSASKAVIDCPDHSLHAPNPANAAEAAKNYQDLFEKGVSAKSKEVILARSYLDGSVVGDFQGHDWDNYYAPAQVPTGFHKMGRFSVLLDLVDIYEDYTDDGTGKSAIIATRTDNNEASYVAGRTPTDAQIQAIPFIKYDNLYEPFKNKDARLNGAIIVPGSTFRGVSIVMQGGLITTDGKILIYQETSAVGLDGKTYGTYGPETGFSGFKGMGSADDANFSSTGFSVRKYLSEEKAVSNRETGSTTPWIDFRLAEVYLNYAEAAVESGSGDQALAAKLINDLRKRAAHKDNIPLSIDNVQKERRIEMAFEGLRVWDLVRRREYHELFDGNYQKKALVPLLDLREPTPKYVFLRITEYNNALSASRFQTNSYYSNIPGMGTNRLVGNPGQ